MTGIHGIPGKAVLIVGFALTAFAAAARSEATTFRVLHSFTGKDGVSPQAALLRDADGNLYGTAVSGGANGAGVVFEISP